MIPKILCSKCNAEVQRTDIFCANCGTRIEWQTGSEAISVLSPTGSPQSQTFQCSLCGHINPPEAPYCEVCGAAQITQGVKTHQKNRSQFSKVKHKPELGNSSQRRIFQFLQSWKLTLGLALVFFIVLMVFGLSRNQNEFIHRDLPQQTADLPMQAQQTLKEIERLQQVVETNPSDMGSTLRLANLLHDVKFFPRSVMMYQRYLKSNPSNPDARVDLGVCYFEMSLADSTHKTELLQTARSEMEKALTYSPKHQHAYFNLGIVSLHSGNLEEANKFFKKCVDLNPTSETGKRARQLYTQHQFTDVP